MPVFRRYCYAVFWIALVAIGATSSVWAVRQLDMENAPLSPRYTDYAIPAAVSALRGLTDYTAYAEVAAHFIHHKERSIAENINITMGVPIVTPDNRWLVSGDDKGLIDLVYVAFQTFGPSISSIYQTVGYLCLISIILYVVAFSRSGPKMALLVAIIASFYAMLFTFGITDQSTAIIEPRFLGFLAIIPLFHVALIVLDENRKSIWNLVQVVPQIAIIITVVHLRSSEIWQPLCVFAASLISLVFIKKQPYVAIVSTVAILIMAIGVVVYRNATYHRDYLTTDVSSRVIWHNAILGLAANPAIRESFKIQILQDGTVTEAVKKYLSDTGQNDLRDTIFDKDNYSEGNFAHFKWAYYEPAAREFYFHIAKTMPLDVLKTYAVFMPKIFIANVSHMMGGTVLQPCLASVGKLEPSDQRDKHYHYLKIFRLIPLLLILFAAILLAGAEFILDRATIIALTIIVAGSMIPPLLVMPVIQYSQLMTMVILAGGYFLVMITIATGVRYLQKLWHSNRRRRMFVNPLRQVSRNA